MVIDRNTNRINDFIKQFSEYKDNILLVEMELSNLSSTYIRKNVLKKQEIIRFLDKDVYEYIIKNSLYVE